MEEEVGKGEGVKMEEQGRWRRGNGGEETKEKRTRW